MSFDPPKSRNEAILQNMLGANNALETPKSREEELLLQILQQGGTGGGVTPEQIAAAVAAYLEEHPVDMEPFEIPVTKSGSTYTTTASAADIIAHVDNCVLVENGVAAMHPTSYAVQGSNAQIIFSSTDSANGFIHNVTFMVVVNNGTVTIVHFEAEDELPAVTAADNGKFLRVVSGEWAAAAVPSAESNSFGGGA